MGGRDEKYKVKVSIIIPIYNLEQYIEGCIKSVLNQDYSNIEIILVDDGSTDNSGIICDKLSTESNGIIRVFHQKNGGVSSARNKGLEVACGEYIVFLDGDDAIVTNYISRLLYLAEETDADIVLCSYKDAYTISERDELSAEFCVDEAKSRRVTAQDMISLLLQHKISPSSCEKMYKRKCIGDVRFWEGKRNNEDKYFYFHTLLNAKNVCCSDLKMYICLNREGSASRMSTSFNFDMIEIAEQIIADISCSKYAEELQTLGEYNFYLTALYCARLLARKHLSKNVKKNYYKIIKKTIIKHRKKKNISLSRKLNFERMLFSSSWILYSFSVNMIDKLKN